ncbi:MAG: uroporphyrinogen decarboxylase family protein, partial [Acidobacteriota bacterium]
PSPLWRCYQLWGFEGMMTRVATRPDLVKYACERYLALSVSAARQAAALGTAGIWIEECMTDMVSPRDFETLNIAFLIPLVAEIRALGMKSIYYFCGNPSGKWDLLLSAGADALALEESKKGFEIDIADAVARVQGRCALLGNLDAIGVLQNGTDAQLRDEIARQMDAGRRNGGRFVMSTGSPVTPETPVERVRQYCDLAHELGGA